MRGEAILLHPSPEAAQRHSGAHKLRLDRLRLVFQPPVLMGPGLALRAIREWVEGFASMKLTQDNK